jgi:hypothetical protein
VAVTGLALGDNAAHRSARGSSMMELLMAASLFAVIVAIALPQFPRSPYVLWTAQQQLLADLRAVRMDALTKGDHFRMLITSGGRYDEYRLSLVGVTWVQGAQPVKTRTLPTNVAFTSGVGSFFDFNTRGLMLNPGAATTLTLSDSYTGKTRGATVWPSGQVVPQ